MRLKKKNRNKIVLIDLFDKNRTPSKIRRLKHKKENIFKLSNTLNSKKVAGRVQQIIKEKRHKDYEGIKILFREWQEVFIPKEHQIKID